MEGDKYFRVPVKDKYAVFTFKPYWHITKIFEALDIPYEMFDTREEVFKGKKFKVVECDQQKITKYRVLSESEEKLPIFFFTANIIDIILEEYGIRYEKEVK